MAVQATKNNNGMEIIGIGDSFRHEIVQMLERIRMFSDFDLRDLELLAGYFIAYSAEQETKIYIEGERSSHMCLLVKGRLAVMKEAGAHEFKKLAEILPGRPIGEMSIIDGQPSSATVIAQEPSVLLMLTKEKLQQIMDKHPAMAVKLIWGITNLISQRLRQTSGKLVDYL